MLVLRVDCPARTSFLFPSHCILVLNLYNWLGIKTQIMVNVYMLVRYLKFINLTKVRVCKSLNQNSLYDDLRNKNKK